MRRYRGPVDIQFLVSRNALNLASRLKVLLHSDAGARVPNLESHKAPNAIPKPIAALDIAAIRPASAQTTGAKPAATETAADQDHASVFGIVFPRTTIIRKITASTPYRSWESVWIQRPNVSQWGR